MASSDQTNRNATIAAWVNDYTDHLLAWAIHKLPDRDTAEDVLQDTFIAASNSFDKFEGKSSPKTWLMSILKNKIYDYYRSKFKKNEISESSIAKEEEDSFFDKYFNKSGMWDEGSMPKSWGGSESLLDNEEFIAILEYCQSKLPPKWYLCIKMKFISGLAGEEICKELGLTQTNYWQIIHRAKLHLRDCLDKNWFAENEQ